MIIAAAIALWQVATSAGWVSSFFVSTPLDVTRAMGHLLTDDTAQNALAQSGTAICLAFVIGTSAGMVAGLLLGLVKVLREAFLGAVVFLLSTPKSIFLPIFTVFLGVGPSTAAIFGGFSAFFYVTVNTVGGVDLIERRHLLVGRAFGARWHHLVLDILLPAARPGLFTATWYGIKQGFIGVVIAELWASSGGIGSLMMLYRDNVETDKVLALILILSLLAILTGSLWNSLERQLMRGRGEAL